MPGNILFSITEKLCNSSDLLIFSEFYRRNVPCRYTTVYDTLLVMIFKKGPPPPPPVIFAYFSLHEIL